MAEEQFPEASAPHGGLSARASLSPRSQVPLVDLAFDSAAAETRSARQEGTVPALQVPHSLARHGGGYVAPNSSRVERGVEGSATLSRANASWHAGNSSTSASSISAAYEAMPQDELLPDESVALMEASNPELFRAALEEHARRLGMDPVADAEHLWLARESLVAPIPDGWYYITATDTGQPYYYNEISGESRWDHPRDDDFRQYFADIKHKQQQGKSYDASQYAASYYDASAGYPSGMAWQDNSQDEQQYTSAQSQANWDTQNGQRQAVSQPEAYYQGYEALNSPYKSPQTQDFASPHGGDTEDYATPNSTSSQSQKETRSTQRESQLAQQLQSMELRKLQDDEQITDMETQIAELQRQLSVREEAFQDVKSEVTQLEEKVAEYKKQLEMNVKEHEDLLAANEMLKEDLSKLQKAQQEQHGRAETTQDLQQRLTSEQHTRAQLEKQLERITSQEATVTKELAAAQATIRQLKESSARQQARDKQEDEAAAANAANVAATAAETIKSIGEQLAQKEKELQVEQGHTNALQQEIVQLKINQVTTKETLEHDLQQKLGVYAAEAETLRQELEAASVSLASAMEEKQALETQLEEHKVASAAQLGEAEDQHRALKREARSLERELKSQQGLSKEREEELTALKRVLESAEAKLATQSQAIESARQQAYEEAEKASTEMIRQAHEEKARVAELYTQEMMARRKLHNRLMELQGNIRVFCRVRPIQPVEQKSEQSALAVFFRDNDHESLDLVVGGEPGEKGNHIGQKHAFEFDHVFRPDSTQEQVFAQTRALVVSALDGFNVCIFAYGQTGSGKTHTMEGPESDRGVNFRALRELFSIRDDRVAAGGFECSLKLSILEVYNETIVDLLDGGNGSAARTPGPASTKGLDVRVGKTGVYVENLIDVEVNNEGDVLDLMRLGHSHRSVGAHDFNEHSSRSHLVLSITLETGYKAEARRRVSKLHLIDLAGSERVSKTAASGQRLKEAQNINRSLSALGDVIAALGASSKHVPYRNSKLTFLLQDSLSGNSKVLMFVNVSPVQWNAWETLCSLNFAARCRSVALGQAKASTATASGASGSGMHATMSMSAMTGGNAGGRTTGSAVRQMPASVPKPMAARN